MLLASGALTASAQSSGVLLRAVAITGDPSPDANGTIGTVDVPSINDAGDVSFRAGILGTLTPSGIFVERSTGLELIARFGDTVPDGNGTYAAFALGPVPINRHGEVAFQSGLSNTSGGLTDNSGIFASGTPNRQVVRRGQPSPGGNGEFDSFRSIGIEHVGTVTFWASFTGTTGGSFVDDRGVYRGFGGSDNVPAPVSELLRMGQLEVGGGATYGNVDSALASDPDGWVAIRVFLTDPTMPLSPLAIVVDDRGLLTRRLTTDDPSPDMNGTIFSFPIPFIGSDGAIATHATFSGSVLGNSDNMGIVSYPLPPGGTPLMLAREADDSPTDGTFVIDFTDALGFASNLVSPSRMVFHAFLSGSNGGAGVDDRGLFLATPTDVSEVVRRGDETPEQDGEFDDFRFGQAHVNPAGCVLFFAAVRNATTLGSGIFRWSSSGGLTTIARIGQSLFGSSISQVEIVDEEEARLAGVSSINAFCDMAFRVRLADGREAIVATVPEPGGHWLAGAALVALAVLRRARPRRSLR